MLAKVHAPALIGLDGELIEIECDLANGLPGFVVVGLGSKAVDEARERVRSAVKNSNLVLPPKRITLNLAPADIPKDGTGYDLGMAVALLIASRQLAPTAADGCVFLGELALEGALRPVRGALLAAQLAASKGFKRLFVPAGNLAEASLTTRLQVIGVDNLEQLYDHLSDEKPIRVVKKPTKVVGVASQVAVDMSHIMGQAQAKRVLEIAAAGGHNLLLTGPPGAGKTMMSRALAGLLPPPSFDEMIEITKLHSLAGRTLNGDIIRERPFRTPHHTASSIALVGGGAIPRPGEISLSHRGILLLDEVPEFGRDVLEALRQPLEDGTITVARAAQATTFPARFMLVATRNRCPCGYAGNGRCNCTPFQVIQYMRRLSGPLIDRIDLIVDVWPVKRRELINQTPAESTAVVAARVQAARRLQLQRWPNRPDLLNAYLDGPAAKQCCQLDAETSKLGSAAIGQLGLSARAYGRLLKVARTIADLDNSPAIKRDHLSEALQYRFRL
jgi:magnesium chelatase family protein